ncbi:hypothetical protein N7450_008284 [Penicillium hetheringtonii]|uniref:Uncharacterized protein n=1 Tax=Penicillium hetheringtonii TaxID=911720 RepID=A0AAD6DG32_9EURO|nr:hypothetical protein N7450_008284 [Penicillium hetheringtonii]
MALCAAEGLYVQYIVQCKGPSSEEPPEASTILIYLTYLAEGICFSTTPTCSKHGGWGEVPRKEDLLQDVLT